MPAAAVVRRLAAAVAAFACLLAIPAPAGAAARCPADTATVAAPGVMLHARFQTRDLREWSDVGGPVRVRKGAGRRGCSAAVLGADGGYLARTLSAGRTTEVSLTYRTSRKGSRLLLRLARNRIRVVDHARGVVRVKRGRRTVLGARRPRATWVTVRLRLDARRRVVSLRAGRRMTTAAVPAAVPERRLIVGGGERRQPPARPAVRTPLVVAEVKVSDPSKGADDRKDGKPKPADGGKPPVDGRPFAATSFWNAPIPADAPLDAKSDAYVAALRSQLTWAPPWINTYAYSTPVYTVPAGQPTVRVKLDTNYTPLQEAWTEVPIPPDAKPAEGTDKHMVVWQPATDRMWEFWLAKKLDDGWHARWGGAMENVSTNPGHFTGEARHWGATATSLPLLGGLMRIEELQRGRIDHALAMAIPNARAAAFSWPAQRTDGSSYAADAPPEGARFRLDPDLDLDALDLPPFVRMMAEAAQRYGIVLRDQSAGVTFYAEQAPPGTTPYSGENGLFGGMYANRLMEAFPWQHLEVLKTEMREGWKVP